MALVRALTDLSMSEELSQHLGDVAAFSLTATGNNSQANGYKLTASLNQFTTVGAATNSAVLPTIQLTPYSRIFVRNDGANALNLFPAGTSSINALAPAAAIAIAAGAAKVFYKSAGNQWMST